MKIDHQYLKDLLITFEDSAGPQTTLDEMKNAGYDPESSSFIFHMRLLGDSDLITRADGRDGKDFHVFVQSGHPEARVSFKTTVPLRLTAKGHDFIADLRQKEVWNSVKENFKDASISTLVEATKQLANGYAKKKIKALTGFDPD